MDYPPLLISELESAPLNYIKTLVGWTNASVYSLTMLLPTIVTLTLLISTVFSCSFEDIKTYLISTSLVYYF